MARWFGGTMTRETTKAESCPECARRAEAIQQLQRDLDAVRAWLAEHSATHAALMAQRDELQVQVTEWELQAVREGILCAGDLDGSTR